MSSWQSTLANVLLIGTGGFIGAVSRVYLSEFVVKRFPGFEASGTLVANVLGCFLIGIVWAFVEAGDILPISFRTFFVSGLLGSLTTFSTFGFQTMQLATRGQIGLALANVGANLFVGLLSVWIGFALSKPFIRSTPESPPPSPEVSAAEDQSPDRLP